MQLVTGISKEAFAILAFLCNVYVMSDSGLVTKLNPWVQYKTVRAGLEVLLFGSWMNKYNAAEIFIVLV